MSTEKTGQTHEHAGNGTATGGCSPWKFAKMMARCCKDMKGECCAMMREMTKGESSQPEQK